MSNKEYIENWSVKTAIALDKSLLYPAEYINDLRDVPVDFKFCLLCRIMIELQSKNSVVLNHLLVEIEKFHPNLAKEGFEHGWHLTYENYLHKIKNESDTNMSKMFDDFLNEAESFS